VRTQRGRVIEISVVICTLRDGPWKGFDSTNVGRRTAQPVDDQRSRPGTPDSPQAGPAETTVVHRSDRSATDSAADPQSRDVESGTCAVVTSDLELLDQVLATAAAAAVEPTVVADGSAVRPLWTGAAIVVVGVDQAPQLAGLSLSRRPDVYVVGGDADREALCAWSGPLGAAVVVLPTAAGWLTTSMSDATRHRLGAGGLVAVLGGSGGVGASTWAAGLAVVAAQRGLRTALVDADQLGGGLDLLLGAERSAGWRWPRLAGARGHLGDLSGQLPYVDGVDLLSVGRGDGAAIGPPGAEQLQAVLRSTSRSHQLTVVDLPRAPDWIAREVGRHADLFLLVVRADVRGVSAARAMIDRLTDGPRPHVVVRTRRGGPLPAAAVADGLDAPLAATVADDNSVRLGAERGDPPARAARSPLAASCRAVLELLPASELAS
jgi:secretion/DNA translocation related CpaE-like protein